jgi:hypothetical protein
MLRIIHERELHKRSGQRGFMVATISRDELKVKIDRGETFKLVETLPCGCVSSLAFAWRDQPAAGPSNATCCDPSAR